MAKRMKMDKGELQSLIAVGFIIFGFIIVAILESIWK
jgi:hypothetical protein